MIAGGLGVWTAEGGLHVESRLKADGLRHGVTTRALGNMKLPESRKAALAAAGLDGDALTAQQVHGTAILDTAERRFSEAGASPASQADGWITAERNVPIAVYVADCLPIFIWDARGEAAGAVHAGWRGVSLGMPRAAVRAFRRFGIGPERLSAAVGPHVGACCYSVGPDVAAKFRPEVQKDSRLDLGAEARLQLLESGLAEDAVSVSDVCTCCRRDEFFSFRRDKLDQRMLAFIALPEGN